MLSSISKLNKNYNFDGNKIRTMQDSLTLPMFVTITFVPVVWKLLMHIVVLVSQKKL